MSKKFTFRLEPILKIREQNKKIAQSEFVSARNERINREQIINEHKSYKEILNKTDLTQLNIQSLRNLHYHKISVEENIKKMESEKEILIEKENVKQKYYNIALQEEKIMQKLKDKQLQNHTLNINKEEQKALDEIGSQIKNKFNG
jgi:flagellar export protein FliJ